MDGWIEWIHSSHRGFPGLEDLSGFFKVTSFLHTLALLGRRLQLLQEGVGSAGAQQHVSPGSVGEH